jgi:transcriptional regulator GlxA family with amidase domain
MKQLLAVLLTITFLTNCNTPSQKVTNIPDYEMPKDTLNVGFLIMDGTFNTELTAPMDIFHHTVFHVENGGMKIFTVAKSKEAVTTFEGMRILPDYSYLENDYPNIDILVVPSAEHHLDSDLEDTAMINWVKRVGEEAQFVTSHCDGAFVIAKSGLLEGFASTTFPSDIPKYKKRFPSLEVYDNVLFVHDKKFITSAGGAKSFEAAMYLVELLYGKKVADGVAGGMVIDWDVSKVPSKIIE